MDTREFVLKGVQDGSITIEQALQLLNEADSKNPGLNLVEQVKQESADSLIEKYIDEALYGTEEDDPEDNLNWDAIERYLIEVNWQPLDHRTNKATNLLETPDIAKQNARENAKWALEGVMKKYIDYKAGLIDEDKVQETSKCGVFTATAWLDNGIHLELEFTPDTGFAYIDNNDIEKLIK